MKRDVELPSEARESVDRAVEHVDRRLSSDEDTAAVVGELLADLFGWSVSFLALGSLFALTLGVLLLNTLLELGY